MDDQGRQAAIALPQKLAEKRLPEPPTPTFLERILGQQ